MHLILWRHAEAEPGTDDLKRKLTDHGRKQAERSAKWLQRHMDSDARVLVSPAVRTRQTADALTRDYEIVPELAPGAEVQAHLDAAAWPNAGGTVIIVGHQPTLGRVAATVIAHAPQDWSMRKSGIWWLACRERGDECQTVIRAVVNPDHL